MIRESAFSFAAAALVMWLGGALPAAAGDTTRIETRPFYGATVTLEEGVRVFRPLPADEHVIINPEGKTPVSLSFSETNVYEHRVVENYNYAGGNGVRVYGGGGGISAFGFVPRIGKANHGHPMHPMHQGGIRVAP